MEAGAAEHDGRHGPPPEALVERFRQLSDELERIADPVARARTEELIGIVLDLYGEGLTRIFETLEAAGDATAPAREALASDGVVASLMLIHDLYPVPLDQRVTDALDSVRPYMESHGGNVELLGVGEDGVARIRLTGSCDGCPASSATLELAIQQALDEHAPDLEGIVVEGTDAAVTTGLGEGATELPVLQSGGSGGNGNGASPPLARGAGAEGLPSWFPASGLGDLEEGTLRTTAVAGRELLVANVEGSLLAYIDRCKDCGDALGGSTLVEGVLCCSGCGRRYYLPRAGRSLDDDGLQLDPVPLLASNGAIRIALPG